jgi:hypothetical protein
MREEGGRETKQEGGRQRDDGNKKPAVKDPATEKKRSWRRWMMEKKVSEEEAQP